MACSSASTTSRPVAWRISSSRSAIKVTSDLERVGDHAVNIAGSTIRMRDLDARFPVPPQLEEMGRLARQMLSDALDAVLRLDGTMGREVCRRDDAVDALLRAAVTPEVDGQALNIGGFPPVSLKTLGDALIRANGGGEMVVKEFPAERKRIDIGDYYADDSRFRKATGWEARVDLDEGLAKCLAYYRTNLDKYL